MSEIENIRRHKLGGLYTLQNCLRTSLLIGGGNGGGVFQRETVSFKKLTVNEIENKKIVQKMDLVEIFFQKHRNL